MESFVFSDHFPHRLDSWDATVAALSQPLHNVNALVDVVCNFYTRSHKDKRPEDLYGLRMALEEVEKLEDFHFMGRVLPAMQAWALDLPLLFPVDAPPMRALVSGVSATVRLTRIQVRSLLAHAFFCNLRNMPDDTRLVNGVPEHIWGDSSWMRVHSSDTNLAANRILCFMNYFRHVLAAEPQGHITFYRRSCTLEELAGLEVSRLPVAPATVTHTDGIEASPAGLHIDFANEDLHFGSIIPSCTQEEVLFNVRPELFVGLLFCDRMHSREAIIMRGARRFSAYTGYLHTFRFAGSAPGADNPEPDLTQIVAMDSIVAYPSEIQWSERELLRDFRKALIGFRGVPEDVAALDAGGPDSTHISTGMWGCGSFGCDPTVKLIQQLMAAGVLGKRLTYSTFLKEDVCAQHRELLAAFQAANFCVADLWALLRSYDPNVRGTEREASHEHALAYARRRLS